MNTSFVLFFSVAFFLAVGAENSKEGKQEKSTKRKIPTADSFLEYLFNATALQVINIAKSFDLDKVMSGHIFFLVYDENGEYETYNGNSSHVPHVDKSKPIKFIIHGWHSTGNSSWVKQMAINYHSQGVPTVISVDWSCHAKKNYLHAAGATKQVGEIVADFIMHVLKCAEHLENVHLIGHSLGAQVSGFVGKQIKNLAKGKSVSRISALDAAAPLFEFPIRVPDFLRLADKDATFVDVVHTNAGFLGFLSAIGDADFYVEFGGPIQPGCTKESNVFESFICSHGKSHQIFIDTIKTDSYKATSCSGPILAIAGLCKFNPKIPMGEPAPANADGLFYIRVNQDDKPKEFSLATSSGSTEAPSESNPILDSLPELQGFS